jgi:hypothetical protein
MFSSQLPWNGLPDLAVCTQVIQGALPGSRCDCNNCPEVEMSDRAWHLLESCWIVDASARPNLPHVRDVIATLKECHDMSIQREISHSEARGLRNLSLESSQKTNCIPALFESHQPSPAIFSLLSGRKSSLRYHHHFPNKEVTDPDFVISREAPVMASKPERGVYRSSGFSSVPPAPYPRPEDRSSLRTTQDSDPNKRSETQATGGSTGPQTTQQRYKGCNACRIRRYV